MKINVLMHTKHLPDLCIFCIILGLAGLIVMTAFVKVDTIATQKPAVEEFNINANILSMRNSSKATNVLVNYQCQQELVAFQPIPQEWEKKNVKIKIGILDDSWIIQRISLDTAGQT